MRKVELVLISTVVALMVASFPLLGDRIQGEMINYSWQGEIADFSFGGQGYFGLDVATDTWSHSLQVSAQKFEGSFEGDSEGFEEVFSFQDGKSLADLEAFADLELESFQKGSWSIERIIEGLIAESDQLDIEIKLENGWLVLNGMKGGRLTRKVIRPWQLLIRIGFSYQEAKKIGREISSGKLRWALEDAKNPPQFWREIHGYKGISVVGQGRVFLKLFWPTPEDKIGREVKDAHVNISITEEENGRENLLLVQRMKYDPEMIFPITKPQFDQKGSYFFELSGIEPGKYKIYLDFFEGNPGEASRTIEIDKTNF